MKLTMLVAEHQPAYQDRIDLAFRELLRKLKSQLLWNKVIRNLAHPDRPALTRTSADQNVIDLEARIGEALEKLAILDNPAEDNADSTRSVWDWVFKSGGFFAQFDADRKAEQKQKALFDKAALVGAGARTSSSGVLGSFGVANAAHRFYGEKHMD